MAVHVDQASSPISAALPPDRRRRAALVIAHPGHELRVHHWLEIAAPRVFVLTDGSGHEGVSRLASTTRLLARAGATPGPIYGRLSDRDLYRALLAKDWPLFAALAGELAAALDAAGIEEVAGDAVEGFNPSHDVCRLLLNAALLRLAAATGRRPANFEVPLESSPEECPAEDLATAVRLRLDDAALERKLAAAAGYPEMAAEVERAFALHGRAPFAVECLRPVRYALEIGGRFAHPPYYETYGERQVAAGHYLDVIRFREHLAPLAAALGAWTQQTPTPTPAPDEARLPCGSC